MWIIRTGLCLVALLSAAFATAYGQTETTVDAVAAVYGSSGTSITGTLASPYTTVYARGYYQPTDGGAGYFTLAPGTCLQSVTANVSGSQVTIAGPLTFAGRSPAPA